MKIKLTHEDLSAVKADILVVNLFEGVTEPGGATGRADYLLGGVISGAIKDKEISGKFGEQILFHTGGKLSSERVMVIGLGKKGDLTPDRIRQLSLIPVKEARKLKKKSLATVLHATGAGGIEPYLSSRFLTMGYLISNYTFDRFKENKDHRIRSLNIVDIEVARKREVRRGIDDAKSIAEGINFARDLVNTPPMYLKPGDLAREARKLAGNRVKVRVYNEKEIKKLKMEGLYSVGMGSSSPPKLIVARYLGGSKKEKPTAIVGKGVTFDTGGISLKKWEGMERMKYDMAGAAAALGVVKALSSSSVKRNVVAVVPVAENMPSGHAYRPGDVIKMMSGKSVEVLSTDAEGRLILGDAICFAIRVEKAGRIIDVATLTGACVVALGSLAMGMMGNDPELIADLKRASENSGERAWELPLYEEYGEQIKSTIADIKNIGGAEGGAITAGFFLKHFTGDLPWAHFDIAGVAWVDKEMMGYPSGATGAGVRLLSEYFMGRGKDKR